LLHIPYWAPPFFKQLPTVVTVHDLIPLILPEYRVNALVRLYTAMVCAATPRATLVVTDSYASQSDIQQHLLIPASRIRAIHLAVDDIYHNQAHSEDTEILHSLDLKPGYVLYLGGFDKRKNLGAIIEAFKSVKNICSNSILVIAGKLPQEDTTFTPDPRKLATAAGLSDSSVRFLGYVSESIKPALYRGARVFTFPTQYEGFGYPPLEALSCGVPVVGSNTSSLPEVVGDAGVLVSPSDIEGLARAILQILTDDAVHNELHNHALQQAKNFSWQNTAQQTFSAYQDAVNQEGNSVHR
jgi:glycosyltransferase involved in cell wall biosynthesis